MKAAVIHEHGGPGSIKIDPAFPDPRPEPTDVVIKVRATTLNYHDIFTRRGMPGIKVPMPCIMGVDFAGDIVETGSAVTDWKVGARVMVDPVDRVGPGGLLGEMNTVACPRITWWRCLMTSRTRPPPACPWPMARPCA